MKIASTVHNAGRKPEIAALPRPHASVPFDPALLTVTQAQVRLGALRHNVRLLREHATPARLRAVVKADAYGHGAVAVAHALQEEGIAEFAVATVPEALVLREAGVVGNLLVFAPPQEAFLAAYDAYDLDVSVTSLDACRVVAAHPAPLRLHLNVDTGMHRLGVMPGDVPEALAILHASPHTLAALWTHFATADEPKSAFAAEQLARFAAARAAAPEVPIHVSNSGALLTGQGMPPGAASVRIGLALYGLLSENERSLGRGALREAMRLTSRVVALRTVAAGETVSYGRTWTASHPTHIATVGAGYADGVRRGLSNVGEVGVRGVRRPIVGRVCMDAFMIDAGPADAAPRVSVGDEVVLFGPGGPSAAEVAAQIGTIAYEIACGVGPRVPRLYDDEP